MTMLPSTTEVYLYIQPIDFSKGIHTLAILVESELVMNPFSGRLFLFTNRRAWVGPFTATALLAAIGDISRRLKMDEKWPHG